MPDQEPNSDQMALTISNPLDKNRAFCMKFFTEHIGNKFRKVSDEPDKKSLNISVGSITSVRCSLLAQNNLLVIMASQIATIHPRIFYIFYPPVGTPKEIKEPQTRVIQFQHPERYWFDYESLDRVDLTTLTDLTINSFLDWVQI